MKNKGITIITLIVMITVIIILTSVFIATGLDSLNEAKNTEKKNEIYLLKEAVINRYTSYEKNNGNVILVGTLAKNKYPSLTDCIDKIIPTLSLDNATPEEKNDKINKISNEITRDYDKFVMIVDSGDRIKLGLENSSDYIYIVNYYTGSIYGPIEE